MGGKKTINIFHFPRSIQIPAGNNLYFDFK